MHTNIEISPYGNLLVYKKGYSPDFVRSTIQKMGLRGLRIFAQLKEERLTDLNFLSEYSFLEALGISSIDDSNFDFLFHLEKLKDLSIIVEGKNPIDLKAQINLENLDLQWGRREIAGIEQCKKITSMCLIEFKKDDFLPISLLPMLKELKVKTASVKTLKGVEKLSQLETLLLGNCTRLKSIGVIESLKMLRTLSIEACSKIDDYNPLGTLSNLQSLRITDCRSVNTIKFIQQLPLLKELHFNGNTNILDGDITPAENIKDLSYRHRKHYNIKIENETNNDRIKQNLERIKRIAKSS